MFHQVFICDKLQEPGCTLTSVQEEAIVENIPSIVKEENNCLVNTKMGIIQSEILQMVPNELKMDDQDLEESFETKSSLNTMPLSVTKSDVLSSSIIMNKAETPEYENGKWESKCEEPMEVMDTEDTKKNDPSFLTTIINKAEKSECENSKWKNENGGPVGITSTEDTEMHGAVQFLEFNGTNNSLSCEKINLSRREDKEDNSLNTGTTNSGLEAQHQINFKTKTFCRTGINEGVGNELKLMYNIKECTVHITQLPVSQYLTHKPSHPVNDDNPTLINCEDNSISENEEWLLDFDDVHDNESNSDWEEEYLAELSSKKRKKNETVNDFENVNCPSSLQITKQICVKGLDYLSFNKSCNNSLKAYKSTTIKRQNSSVFLHKNALRNITSSVEAKVGNTTLLKFIPIKKTITFSGTQNKSLNKSRAHGKTNTDSISVANEMNSLMKQPGQNLNYNAKNCDEVTNFSRIMSNPPAPTSPKDSAADCILSSPKPPKTCDDKGDDPSCPVPDLSNESDKRLKTKKFYCHTRFSQKSSTPHKTKDSNKRTVCMNISPNAVGQTSILRAMLERKGTPSNPLPSQSGYNDEEDDPSCPVSDNPNKSNKYLKTKQDYFHPRYSQKSSIPYKTKDNNKKTLIMKILPKSVGQTSSSPLPPQRSCSDDEDDPSLLSVPDYTRCYKCDKLFKIDQYKQHMKYSLCGGYRRKSKFKCDICGKLFNSREKLESHTNSHNNSRPFKCFECDHRFNSKVARQMHVKQIHLKKKLRYLCCFCAYITPSRKHLEAHEKEHQLPEGTEAPKPFKCLVCGKGFISQWLFGKHRKEHQLKKCTTCQETFKTRTQLRNHMETAHSIVKIFECTECGMKFKNQRSFSDHSKTHSTVLAFTCDICDKGFKRKGNLQQHMISHSNERPIACPKCGDRFKRITHLKQHTAAFHGDGKK